MHWVMINVRKRNTTCTALARVAAGAEDEHGVPVCDDFCHERQQLVLRWQPLSVYGSDAW